METCGLDERSPLRAAAISGSIFCLPRFFDLKKEKLSLELHYENNQESKFKLQYEHKNVLYIEKETLSPMEIQQDVYVPAYSDIYYESEDKKTFLTVILSLRNTSFSDTLYFDKIDYYSSSGELLKNYIDLEKVRYGKRVIVEFDHEIQGDVKIAPLLLLTFLENAFKHGASIDGFLQVNIAITFLENSLDFQIKNTVKANKVREIKEGIGLRNIKKRLDILYPEKYNLQLQNTDNWFLVFLHFSEKYPPSNLYRHPRNRR